MARSVSFSPARENWKMRLSAKMGEERPSPTLIFHFVISFSGHAAGPWKFGA